MEKPTAANNIEQLVSTLKTWQELERNALETTARVMEQTSNPVVRQVMEIIRNDSLQHHRVQQFLIDSFTRTPVTLTPDDMKEIWEQIEAHDRTEKRTIELANQLWEQCRFPVQKVLLDYLIIDEEKHDRLLEHLNEIKKGMYPYGS
jgi:hypothetical protein